MSNKTSAEATSSSNDDNDAGGHDATSDEGKAAAADLQKQFQQVRADFKLGPSEERTLAIGGSITVWLVSNRTSLDLTAPLDNYQY